MQSNATQSYYTEIDVVDQWDGVNNSNTNLNGVGGGIEVDSVVPKRLVAEHGQHRHDGVGEHGVPPLVHGVTFLRFMRLLLLFHLGEQLCEEEGESAAPVGVVERGLLLLAPELQHQSLTKRYNQ